MSESKEEQIKRVNENLESVLPRLWEQASGNVAASKIKYMENLHTKLLDQVESRVSKPVFNAWFSDIIIEDISGNKIFISTRTLLQKEWLDSPTYSSLLQECLQEITNNDADFVISFVVSASDVPDSLKGKSTEELWELAFSKEELSRQKELQLKRKLKPDYDEPLLNIIQCVLCGSENVPNVPLSIPLKSNNARIVSVTIIGAKCSECGEEYYSMQEIDAINNIELLLKELFADNERSEGQ